MIVSDYPGSTILVEHGHFCDPALLLYLKDLADRTYRQGKFEDFLWKMQRPQGNRPDEKVSPGRLPPVDAKPQENAYHAARKDQKPLPRAAFWSRLRNKLWRWGGKVMAPMTMEHWWQSGIERMEEYLAKAKADGKELKPLLYQIYGHTHRADPREPVAREGVSCTYINAGTWTEEVDQGWYLDVDAEGKVWLQDWINETAELRRL